MRPASASRTIPLTQGRVATVDAADFDFLSQWKWQAIKNKANWYAVRGDYSTGRKVLVRMHRLLMPDLPDGAEPDHKNRDGLDNRRANLRPATPSQNAVNRDYSWRERSTQYRGIYPRPNGKWTVTIRARGKARHLGTYSDPEHAARVFDEAAKTLHGDFAVLNFPGDL